MACFDIDKFRVVNDQYGTLKGDEILKHIANTFKDGFGAHGGICCRVAADDFAVLYPADFQNSDEISLIRERACQVEDIIAQIIFHIGRYTVNDTNLSTSAMYDRAMLALESVKGQHGAQIGYYDETMRDKLLIEQQLVNEMELALSNRQFEIWFQPQYNHFTGAMIGAEALVRWVHPERGLISPDLFIPVFEKNGFIYDLDKYVWEEACRFLYTEAKAGRKMLPVSVNISRQDVFHEDIVDVILGLVQKYEIPTDQLRLEITESAFAKSTEQIVETVRTLIEHGFTLEIDDFGSGCSSLNTLKDVPAQVVKLDMKFLENKYSSGRGGSIVESVVRMIKWLDMSVIAEGVETKEQADFLLSIGCNYIQGYYYARPMPQDEYRQLCIGADVEKKIVSLETAENLDNNAFWDPDSLDSLIFNSYVGAACVFEYNNDKIEVIRFTKKFVQMINRAGLKLEDARKINWVDYLDEASKKALIDSYRKAIISKEDVSNEYVFADIPGCANKLYLRTSMRVIATAGNSSLIYCLNDDITAQRMAEEREHKLATQMRTLLQTVDWINDKHSL